MFDTFPVTGVAVFDTFPVTGVAVFDTFPITGVDVIDIFPDIGVGDTTAVGVFEVTVAAAADDIALEENVFDKLPATCVDDEAAGVAFETFL